MQMPETLASLSMFVHLGPSQDEKMFSVHPAIRTLQDAHIPPKSDYDEFRDTLYEVTRECLKEMAKDEVDLAELNNVGVFHKFDEKAGNVYQDFGADKSMPDDWIYRGSFPGIWCALKSPNNTYTIALVGTKIGQFKFNTGFKIYDPQSTTHMEKWEIWKSRAENSAKHNPWDDAENTDGLTMSTRVGLYLADANDFNFYLENGYGAVVGYTDYVSLVIVDKNLVSDLLDAGTVGMHLMS
ncbi:hypothetical protein AYO21_09261 [Fonsecaea monophora]|uniref:Uncharacterized protein n=1 Tax=Fonsecaea monophora TaxID=254056 RepID=A0A177EZ46_9EURO|nr:hypothetical protein AYO21_09261 [Fonsecaea monophora]KAH0829903.1 hypothetical protein FOPE_10715 [Fonsecaea pedrosoi]OAG36530.1 hypothetical protein AYO21_09261 [Fonsecaea monophora]